MMMIAQVARDLWQHKQTLSSGCTLRLIYCLQSQALWYNYYISLSIDPYI